MAERRYGRDDYESRLEAKRKDDEKRWRDLQYQLSVGSPMGQTNKAVEAMQMLGQISGAGGTRPSATPPPSWMNAPTAGPRPMMTPEQREAAELQRGTEGKVRGAVEAEAEAKRKYYEGDGKFGATGRGGDDDKRLQDAIKYWSDTYFKFLDKKGGEDPDTINARKKWGELTGMTTPEETVDKKPSMGERILGAINPFGLMWGSGVGKAVDDSFDWIGKDGKDVKKFNPSSLSGHDKEAYEWATKNRKDARAQRILKTLGAE